MVEHLSLVLPTRCRRAGTGSHPPFAPRISPPSYPSIDDTRSPRSGTSFGARRGRDRRETQQGGVKSCKGINPYAV